MTIKTVRLQIKSRHLNLTESFGLNGTAFETVNPIGQNLSGESPIQTSRMIAHKLHLRTPVRPMSRLGLWLFSFMMTVLTLSAARGELTQNEIKTLFAAYEQTMKRFSPDQYFHLNLGVSMGPWSLLMELDPRFQKIANGFAYTPVENLDFMMASEPLSYVRVSKHLALVLPPAEMIQDRDIVVNRILLSGNTIRNLIPHMVRYLDEHGYKSKLLFNVALNEDDRYNLIEAVKSESAPLAVQLVYMKQSLDLSLSYSETGHFFKSVSPIKSFKAKDFEKTIPDTYLENNGSSSRALKELIALARVQFLTPRDRAQLRQTHLNFFKHIDEYSFKEKNVACRDLL